MSGLKASEELPSVDALLPEAGAHETAYWTAIEPHLGDHAGSDAVRKPVGVLTADIRRRVDDALEAADGEVDDAVESLRSIYREVKTRSVDACVQGLLDAVALHV